MLARMLVIVVVGLDITIVRSVNEFNPDDDVTTEERVRVPKLDDDDTLARA